MKMKDVRKAIEDAPINEQFKALASEALGNDNPIFSEYAKWKKTALILTILGLLPGILFMVFTKGGMNEKIRLKYKQNIEKVLNKYSEKHPLLGETEVVQAKGHISRKIDDPYFDELRKTGRATYKSMNWGNSYKKRYNDKYDWRKHARDGVDTQWSIFDGKKDLMSGAMNNLFKMQSGVLSESATAFELGVISFDLARYLLSSNMANKGPGHDCWFTRVYLRNDVEIQTSIMGIDLRLTNYVSIMRSLSDVKDDQTGKVRTVEKQINGVGGVMIYGDSGMKLKGDIVLACKKNLLVRAAGPFLGVKIQKDPFESVEFNQNYELATSSTFDEISLFKRFSAKLVDKLDQLREQFPGFMLSVKKDGSFVVAVGAYRSKDVPLSLDNPGKFAKNKEYAADIIKSDLIYINSLVTVMQVMNELKLIDAQMPEKA